jgi:tripartite-type tricarboxylate transporter receptor subunit TctC
MIRILARAFAGACARAFALACVLGAALAVVIAGASPAAASDYPAGPVRLFVGFPPGGTTDVIGRLLAKELSDILGKPVLVENRAGVSGGIAAGAVARSAPDGLTLLVVPSTHATNPFLYASLPYDPDKDLAPVSLVATTPYVLVTHPDVGASDYRGLMTYLKANPGKVNYASASPGTGQHLAGELFGRMADVKIVHIPYKGSSAALPDLMAGRVQMMFENVAVMTPHVRQGSLRALAVTGPKRSSLLPEVPTVAESGLPGFEVVGWFGLLAPAGTPVPIIEKLNAAVNQALAGEAMVKRLGDMGADPMGGTAAAFASFLAGESAKWGKVIREARITVN